MGETAESSRSRVLPLLLPQVVDALRHKAPESASYAGAVLQLATLLYRKAASSALSLSAEDKAAALKEAEQLAGQALAINEMRLGPSDDTTLQNLQVWGMMCGLQV